DRDGDVDLFVWGRIIPGQYPLSPNSRLLVNESGAFSDRTDELTDTLKLSGLITSALWSDVDGDGWLDLLVTTEWGPVRIWKNLEGRLTEMTAAAGLESRTGWWNSIVGGDLDLDGDIDYVVGNFGLNTKYKASPESPSVLYYGDFFDDGGMRLVEAVKEKDIFYPVRGRECTLDAMPSLTNRFLNYDTFAKATLAEIYSPEHLEDAWRFEINTLESCVLINDGRGRFDVEPLPLLAQVAPVFGMALADVDGDGWLDLYLAQNFFQPQFETGQMDGGVSLLLRGGSEDGRPKFSTIWPHVSGLIVPGDGAALTSADLNLDGWPDFVIGLNDTRLGAFENRGQKTWRSLSVRLKGPKGNPSAIGARARLRLESGLTLTREVYAGGGYLSQSSPALSFGIGLAEKATELRVLWPDGRETSLPEPVFGAPIEVAHEAAVEFSPPEPLSPEALKEAAGVRSNYVGELVLAARQR
ncbi:MAG: CRTAC1 family protein, partial [Verrucomicrobiota bacterium]